MGAFEFDLSARNCCDSNNNGAGETCIIAQKIFDQCRIQKCLTSDILGGKNAGLRTVWVNPRHKTAPEDLKPDFEIELLADLPALLEEIE